MYSLQNIRHWKDLSRRLISQGPRHYLLAASGVSPGSALRDLSSLNSQIAAASRIQASVAPDTDLETYVANLQSQSTLALIADGLNRSARDFETFLEDNVTMEWDAQRRRIYEHFGLASKDGDPQSVNSNPLNTASPGSKGSFGRSTRRGRIQNLSSSKGGNALGGSVFGAAAMQKSIIGTPGSISNGNGTLFADVADKAANGGASFQDSPLLRDKEGKYAEKVQRLNEARIQERVFPVLQEFANVEAQAGEDVSITLT